MGRRARELARLVVSTRSLGPACNVRAIDLRGERLSRFHKFSSIPKPSAARARDATRRQRAPPTRPEVDHSGMVVKKAAAAKAADAARAAAGGAGRRVERLNGNHICT